MKILSALNFPQWVDEERSKGVYIDFQLLRNSEKPIIIPNGVIERGLNIYGSIVETSNGYRMYAQAINRVDGCDKKKTTFVKSYSSPDGMTWAPDESPALLSSGRTELCSPSVIRGKDGYYYMIVFEAFDICDREVDGNISKPGWRAIEGEGIYFLRSTNGENWDSKSAKLLVGGEVDTCSFCIVNGRYEIYFKRGVYDRRHFREIWRITSEDLVTWSHPEMVLCPSMSDPIGTEFYYFTTFRWNDDYYGLLNVYRNAPNDKGVHIELVYMTADGCWNRYPSKPTILAESGPTGWDCGRVYAGVFLRNHVHGEPAVDDHLLNAGYLYYGGSRVKHDDKTDWTLAIGACPMDLRELGSLYAPREGSIYTRSFTKDEISGYRNFRISVDAICVSVHYQIDDSEFNRVDLFENKFSPTLPENFNTVKFRIDLTGGTFRSLEY